MTGSTIDLLIGVSLVTALTLMLWCAYLFMRYGESHDDAMFLWLPRYVRVGCNGDTVCGGRWAWLVWARPCACGGLAVIE